jgi:transcriptional regulator with XRE-family HTH domain
MDDQRAIGARIRLARTTKGLTQVDLAAAIGVSRAHLTNVEGGNGGLALDKLSALARETGTTVAWLIGEAGPVDQAEAELTAAFRSLDQRDRETALRIIQSLRRDDPPPARPLPPVRPVGPDPPRPFTGGNVAKPRVTAVGSGRRPK